MSRVAQTESQDPAGQDWTYMQQYADAKGEVVEAIMQRAERAGG